MDSCVFPSIKKSQSSYCAMCWSLISEHVVNHIFDSKTDLDLGTKVLLEQLLPEQDANVLAGLLEQALYCDNCIQAIKTIQQKSEAMKSLSGEIKSLSNQIGMRIAKNNSEPTQDIIKNQISDVNLKKLLSIRSKIIAKYPFHDEDYPMYECQDIEHFMMDFQPLASFVPATVSARDVQPVPFPDEYNTFESEPEYRIKKYDHKQLFYSPSRTISSEDESEEEVQMDEASRDVSLPSASHILAASGAEVHDDMESIKYNSMEEDNEVDIEESDDDKDENEGSDENENDNENSYEEEECEEDSYEDKEVAEEDEEDNENSDEEDDEEIFNKEGPDEAMSENKSKQNTLNIAGEQMKKLVSASDTTSLITAKKSIPTYQDVSFTSEHDETVSHNKSTRSFVDVRNKSESEKSEAEREKSSDSEVFTQTKSTEQGHNKIALRSRTIEQNQANGPGVLKKRYRAKYMKTEQTYSCTAAGCSYKKILPVNSEKTRNAISAIASHEIFKHKYPDQPKRLSKKHVLHKTKGSKSFFECPECYEQYKYNHLVHTRNKSRDFKRHYGLHVIGLIN